jgi:hypothetical protein
MSDDESHDDDEIELSADDVEEMMVQFGAELRTDIDVERLKEVNIHAVAAHPDRDNIVELMERGAHFFIKPLPDDAFTLSIGFFDDPALNPPDTPTGKTWEIGEIEMSHVRRRPQG